jgi:hypothetical protein
MDEHDPMAVRPEFRDRLSGGKYTRWAANVTEDELELVLWCVGEFGIRMPHQQSHRSGHLPLEFTGSTVGADGQLRALLALEALANAVHGEPSSLDQWKRDLVQRLSARGTEA